MTREEKIIATAFTGKMFIDGSEMRSLYEYMEKKVGHEVIDLMLASKDFWEELHKACEQDFINMVSKEQPSLPSDLDEVADNWRMKDKIWKGFTNVEEASYQYIYDASNDWMQDKPTWGQVQNAFKAGAEWMAGQFQKIEAEGLIGWFESTAGKEYCFGLKSKEAFEVPEGFYIKKK